MLPTRVVVTACAILVVRQDVVMADAVDSGEDGLGGGDGDIGIPSLNVLGATHDA